MRTCFDYSLLIATSNDNIQICRPATPHQLCSILRESCSLLFSHFRILADSFYNPQYKSIKPPYYTAKQCNSGVPLEFVEVDDISLHDLSSPIIISASMNYGPNPYNTGGYGYGNSPYQDRGCDHHCHDRPYHAGPNYNDNYGQGGGGYNQKNSGIGAGETCLACLAGLCCGCCLLEACCW